MFEYKLVTLQISPLGQCHLRFINKKSKPITKISFFCSFHAFFVKFNLL